MPHHLKAAEHYTLCRTHYDTHRVFYPAHNCVVLHGSDPLSLWVNLLLANWGYSAEMTEAQKRAFCRYRTRPLGSKPANKLEASAVALAAKAQKAAQKELKAAEGQQQRQAAKLDGTARAKVVRVKAL